MKKTFILDTNVYLTDVGSIMAWGRSDVAVPTVILDEIDTGVSGEMAKAMGSFMKDISEHTQLIAITHLPQIAAMGNSHFKVYKSSDDNTTRTYIKRLEGEDRVVEIAQMIDGNQITQTARTLAEKLLN